MRDRHAGERAPVNFSLRNNMSHCRKFRGSSLSSDVKPRKSGNEVATLQSKQVNERIGQNIEKARQLRKQRCE